VQIKNAVLVEQLKESFISKDRGFNKTSVNIRTLQMFSSLIWHTK
jgi:hypothetical protein